MTAATSTPTSTRKLSTQGRIRVSIENKLETWRGKRVNISSPHYKLVQAVAAHLDAGNPDKAAKELMLTDKPKSFNGSGLYELRLTLAECLAEVDHFIACQAAKA